MSFWLSFHQALLGRTGPHWLDTASNVTCKESTRQYAVDGALLSCKQQLGGSSPPPAPKSAGLTHRCANLTVTSTTAGDDECLATLAVQMPSSPPALSAPNRTTQRT
jgi:hypothetical protein